MEAPKDVSIDEAPGQAPAFNGICSTCYSAAGKSSRSLCRVKRKHTDSDWWFQFYPVGARVLLLKKSQEINYVLGYENVVDKNNLVNVSLCLSGPSATTTVVTKMPLKHAKASLQVVHPAPAVPPPPQGDPPPHTPPTDPIHTKGSGDGIAHTVAESLRPPTPSSRTKPPGNEDPAKDTGSPSSTSITLIPTWSVKRKRDQALRDRIRDLEMDKQAKQCATPETSHRSDVPSTGHSSTQTDMDANEVQSLVKEIAHLRSKGIYPRTS